ncbi:MAG: alkaline phosphatase family protein [Deltaproteobacteria bacterium]|nr:alkaline phosphatase family protein [Deltaproteobacteria bacterium]
MRSHPLVVLAVLDAFPHEQLDDALTPSLAALAREGGAAPRGGRAVLSASTYPNHATFVTGATPAAHRIFTSRALQNGAFVPAQDVGPQVPTIFERCRALGRRSVAVVGDQNLIGVCGAGAADTHWPPDGVLDDDAPRGRLGFGADRGVAAAVDGVEMQRADFVFLQLDEIDTERHLHGVDAPESREQCSATDAAFGEILERLLPIWDEVVVIAVSDHDHEAVEPGAIDLAAACRERELDVIIDHDGTAAVVVGRVSDAVLLALPGVTQCAKLDLDCTLVWGDPGQQFGIDWGLRAQHGSPRTNRQLAVVGGGHAAAGELAARIRSQPPHATRWAKWVAELLGLPDEDAGFRSQ